ncbi:MAG TPA: cysteine--tRNA ligase [Egibacteraceae bacterium]|nr:cysteine--tRNA ligase [Egibacteraceae bacterium]HVM14543.1 cysteine--tRNA ligase [Egibacteraceae bacterium]
MIRLHDTALGRTAGVELRDAGKVSLYVCGPTVDNHPHIGHGRMALVWDVLRRYLEWMGLDVRFVSNITDIDDKIIARANAEGRSHSDVAVQYEAAWYDAMDRLGVKRPTVDPHATAYVDQMVELIAGLVAAGKAYETSDGVYLSVDTVPGYGLLARQALDTLRSGARVDVVDEKRTPLDFALWKKAKPDEPSWPSPWGDGRPGWHTECVVMSLDLLGEDFDIHGGGIDLAFPHHENERAQAIAAGRGFSRRWAHNGHVQMGGEKMSKSLGNITNLTDLLASVDPRAYRLVVLQSHYRAPVEVTGSTIDAATATLAGLDAFARRSAELPAAGADPEPLDRFRTAMDDDLDTPRAMAELLTLVKAANTALDAGDTTTAAAQAAAVREMAAAVGLVFRGGDDEIPTEVAELVAGRDEARAKRDFAGADAIRDRLIGLGWAVEDTPQGTRVHRKDT